MERDELIERLEMARRRVKLGQDQIDHQHMAIATLFAEGSEIEEAENRLRVYQRLQNNYVGDMRRILYALEGMPLQPPAQAPADLTRRAGHHFFARTSVKA
jgi:hypothetical protein